MAIRRKQKEQINKDIDAALQGADSSTITIWDLDYYYNPRHDSFNPIVMKLSSYYKQRNYRVNFVRNLDDTKRPAKYIFIFKEKMETRMPEVSFFLKTNVKWCGEALTGLRNWKPNVTILGCRPDYLIYPNYMEQVRDEQIQLVNNHLEFIDYKQDYRNSFKRKDLIIVDEHLWDAATETIIKALDSIKDFSKHWVFRNPINLSRVLSDAALKDYFLNTSFSSHSVLKWEEIAPAEYENALNFMEKLLKNNSALKIQTITINYSNDPSIHWNDRLAAQKDFNALVSYILAAKRKGIHLKILGPELAFETPYFFIFEAFSEWTEKAATFRYSWLEWLTGKFWKRYGEMQSTYWVSPQWWTKQFRQLLYQTYEFIDLLTLQWKDKSIDASLIPTAFWRKEFTNGI